MTFWPDQFTGSPPFLDFETNRKHAPLGNMDKKPRGASVLKHVSHAIFALYRKVFARFVVVHRESKLKVTKLSIVMVVKD